MNEVIKVLLKKGKEKSVLRFHPWIFTGAIEGITGEPEDGEIVEIYSNDKTFLAAGFFQKEGSIAIKIFSFKKEEYNTEFWKLRIKKAHSLREILGLINNPLTNAFRLIHGESDMIPGLIVDCYNDTAVIQFHNNGVYKLRDTIVESLLEIYDLNLKAIYNKSEATLTQANQQNIKNGFLFGNKVNPIKVIENGNSFLVDYIEGQKTGFFVDQRDNRRLLEYFCKNKKVLNIFCYTGGFSVSAIKSGAKLVHSLDSSKKAIDLTSKNIELNFPNYSGHKTFIEDAFNFVENFDEDYDIVVLDPPAFAKQLHLKDKGLKGYRNINTKVIGKMKKGCILFTFSCSQAISKEDFRTMIFSASAMAGKNVKILHQLSQSADHPINIYHPESEYLKGFALYID